MVWWFVCTLLCVVCSGIATTGPDAPTDHEIAAAFNSWLEAHYEIPMLIEVRPTPTMRYGAFARKDLKDGQLYSATPYKLLMSADSIRQSPKSFYMELELHSALLLFLLYERHRGTRSFWKPYIDILPVDYDTPAHWADDELEILAGTTVLHAVREEKLKDVADFKRLGDFLSRRDPDASAYWNVKTYRWAASVLDSRTIHIAGRIHLVPMLDMINNRHHTNVQKVHTTNLGSTKAAETRTLWSFSAGQEVFESYGQPNHIYYRYHSFMIPDNHYDCYPYNLSPDVIQRANEYSQSQGLQFRVQRTHICLKPDGNVPNDAVTAYAVKHAADKDGTRLPSARYTEVPLENGKVELRSALQQRLSEYPTTIAADTALLEAEDELDDSWVESGPRMSYVHKLAIRYRRSEKQLLRRIIRALPTQAV